MNYHHLLYFWSVASHGSLTKASAELNITPQTVSAQIRTLETTIGAKLFDRHHRRLELTELGKKVFEHAEAIFAAGQELQDFLLGARTESSSELVIGIANALPKFVVYHILEPAMLLEPCPHMICHEDKAERLMAGLALHDLDVVLSDIPVPPNVSVHAYNHLLGKCEAILMGSEELVARFGPGFPGSLKDAPFLLPTKDTALRKSMDRWFRRHRIRPRIIAEHEDSALLKSFGEAGIGVYPIASVVEQDVESHYRAKRLGVLKGVDVNFFAITVEKHLQHPAVSAICQQAREIFFGRPQH